MDEVTVRWPSGQSEVLKNVAADFIYTIVEGQGIKDKVALPAVEAAALPARQEDAGSRGARSLRP
jgi:hypothetical protein